MSPGEAYSRRAQISIPRDIYGVYHIIVKTDIYNEVFEYLSTNNNDLASVRISISLQIMYSQWNTNYRIFQNEYFYQISNYSYTYTDSLSKRNAE